MNKLKETNSIACQELVNHQYSYQLLVYCNFLSHIHPMLQKHSDLMNVKPLRPPGTNHRTSNCQYLWEQASWQAKWQQRLLTTQLSGIKFTHCSHTPISNRKQAFPGNKCRKTLSAQRETAEVNERRKSSIQKAMRARCFSKELVDQTRNKTRLNNGFFQVAIKMNPMGCPMLLCVCSKVLVGLPTC